MRALTVRQPWAWAIIHGGKDVENRSRSLGPYRGPVAIHAGLTWDDEASADHPVLGRCLSRWVDDHGLIAAPAFLPCPWWIKGAVIGVVDLVQVHRPRSIMCAPCSPWAEPDGWHLVLANPRPLAHPIPWRGALGLWTVTADLEAAIREQVSL